MARQRRERGSEKQNEANIPSPDLPPSYEDTIKSGQAGGFVDPNTTGGLPVKTIVQVVQVRIHSFQKQGRDSPLVHALRLLFHISSKV